MVIEPDNYDLITIAFDEDDYLLKFSGQQTHDDAMKICFKYLKLISVKGKKYEIGREDVYAK